jgi:hypothetical protein
MISSDGADTLYLNPTVSDIQPASSRGAMLDNNTTLSTFNLISTVTSTSSATTHLFINQPYTRQSSDQYRGATNYYWPGSNWSVDFFASTAEINATTSAIDYTVPADVTAQSDILYASATNLAGNSDCVVDLTFNHACAAVRFTCTEMPAGKITAVALNGVSNKGSFSFATSAWILDASTANFSYTKNVYSSDSEKVITSDSCIFMMLPQTLPDDAEISVTFDCDVTGTRTYTHSLKGVTWESGKAYSYNISISADYGVSVTSSDLTSSGYVDAHYVMPKIQLTRKNYDYSKITSYKLSVDNGATLIRASDASSYITDGYWIDDSSRPTSITLNSSSDFNRDFYVMIPENTTGKDRDITLTVSMLAKDDDRIDTLTVTKAIHQYAPENGWERIDDNLSSTFGFLWSRDVYYEYQTTAFISLSDRVASYLQSRGISTDVTVDGLENSCQTVIDGYGANQYATDFATTYTYSYTTKILGISVQGTRCSIFIQYSKYNNLTTNTDNDGLANTTYQYERSSIVVDDSFEQYLKTNYSSSFSVTDGQSGSPSAPTEELNAAYSPAVLQVLKKNKFTLNADGTLTPEIVWYIPAVNEFANCPYNAASYWSSTGGTDPNTQAYNGAGTLTPRSTTLKIIARRQ